MAASGCLVRGGEMPLCCVRSETVASRGGGVTSTKPPPGAVPGTSHVHVK